MVRAREGGTNHLGKYDMSDSEIAELSREWRADVKESIAANTDRLDRVLEEISKIRSEFAPQHRHDELADRVRSLEDNQSRFMGGIIILNLIGGIALSLIMRFWK